MWNQIKLKKKDSVWNKNRNMNIIKTLRTGSEPVLTSGPTGSDRCIRPPACRWRHLPVKNSSSGSVLTPFYECVMMRSSESGSAACWPNRTGSLKPSCSVPQLWRRGRGDYFQAVLFLAELSTPSVCLGKVLIQYQKQNSVLHKVNGVFMLLSFFSCRVLLFPYLYYAYSRYASMPLYRVPLVAPWQCNLGAALLWPLQLYWFSLICRGALRRSGRRPKVDESGGWRRSSRRFYETGSEPTGSEPPELVVQNFILSSASGQGDTGSLEWFSERQRNVAPCCLFYSIVFYFVLFPFDFILFYSVLFYFILLYFILFCSILFCFFYSVVFFSILFNFILFYSVLSNSILFSSSVAHPFIFEQHFF